MKKKILFIVVNLFIGLGVFAQENVWTPPKFTALVGTGINGLSGADIVSVTSVVVTAYWAGLYFDTYASTSYDFDYNSPIFITTKKDRYYCIMAGPVFTIPLTAKTALKIFPMIGLEPQGGVAEFRYGSSLIFCYRRLVLGLSGKVNGCTLNIGISW